MACGRAEARTLSTDEGGDMMRAAREVAQTRWELGGTNDSGGMDEEGNTDVGAERMRGTTGWRNEGSGTDEAAARTRQHGH